MHARLKIVLVTFGLAIASQAIAQITFYERQGFEGRSFTMEKQVRNFERYGFNDRASSVVVTRNRWEVCEDIRFRGQCMILRPGHYPSIRAMGMNNNISSARIVNRNARFDNSRYAPLPVTRDQANYNDRRRDNDNNNYRRQDNERLYEANVTSVRAVVGTPEQRCWIEREQVAQERGDPNVPAAIAGALIGGILGHQIGGGSGKNIATAGGVIAGGLVGANIGRDNNQQTYGQDVQRCSNTPRHNRPDYWDVTYRFRNQDHRVQMTSPPGATITVNERGEPRQ